MRLVIARLLLHVQRASYVWFLWSLAAPSFKTTGPEHIDTLTTYNDIQPRIERLTIGLFNTNIDRWALHWGLCKSLRHLYCFVMTRWIFHTRKMFPEIEILRGRLGFDQNWLFTVWTNKSLYLYQSETAQHYRDTGLGQLDIQRTKPGWWLWPCYFSQLHLKLNE